MSAQFQFYRPPITRSVIVLWVLMGAGWLARVLVEPLRELIGSHLAISASNVDTLALWTPLTYWLWEPDIFPVVLHGALAYLFGGEIIARKGEGAFWKTLLGGAVLGGVASALVTWGLGLLGVGLTLPGVIGYDAALSALVASYCWMYWDREMRFFTVELDGKRLLGFFVALNVIFSLIQLHPGVLGAHLGGYAAGLLIGSDMQAPRRLLKHLQYWRIRRRLKVVARTPEDDEPDTKRRRKDGQWIN